MLDAHEIRQLHDKAFTHNQTTRERAADDMLFYWISQWDDQFLSGTTLQYRGQFDMLRKAGRQIISDIKSNPTQVDFEPVAATDETSGEIIDGMYRSDMRNNMALEAKENATTEAIVCGVGAWELFHEYRTNVEGDDEQVIKRRPFYEANNQVFWEPNAKLLDKADAEWVSCLVGYSEDGYKELHLELTGEVCDNVSGSFAFPEHSYVYPWIEDDRKYYVTRFFHRELIKVKSRTYADIFGSEKVLNEDDDEDDLDGFELVSETEKNQYVIRRYIVGGGDEVLDSTIVAGEHIPVVPVYGERAFVEGEEHWEGITRLAKDPQRLRNFQLSYLADLASRTPRIVPIYLAEQLQTFENMYEENGPDDNFPYRLQNRYDGVGVELPFGPVGQTPDQPAPTALLQCIEMSRSAMEDVAGTNLPKDIQDMDLSGEALVQLGKMFDKQSFTYQHNLKSALRRDGEIYASMASVIHDVEKDVAVVSPDGSSSTKTINQEEIDPETLRLVVNNDIKHAAFEVYADVGPSYQSVKEQSRKEMKEMINSMAPDDPMRPIYMLTYSTMSEGLATKDIRSYARKQLILMDVKEPETDEEKQMYAEAQQAQQAQSDQPDALMVAAIAESKSADAELANAETKRMGSQTDQFNAETKRAEMVIKARESGMNIQYKQAQTDGQRLDNVGKLTGRDLRRA